MTKNQTGLLNSKMLVLTRGLLALSLVSLIAVNVTANHVYAQTRMTDVSSGKVITMNGLKFVKIRNDPVKGAQFMSMQAAPPIPYTGTMQAFTTAMCNSYPTPTGTNYTYVGKMTDSRDSKQYEVRKFADGKCWMVDNLAFGSGCLKTTFTGSATAGTGTNGSSRQNVQAGYYGDCRYPYASTATSDATNKYGYLYDWVAATQNTSAYFSNAFQPAQPTQGICPTGWSLPIGGSSSQFQALHIAAGSPVTGFWQPGGNWKGVYSGSCSTDGTLSQGFFADFWSSSAYDSSYVYNLYFTNTSVSPNNGFYSYKKNDGSSVRCIKD